MCRIGRAFLLWSCAVLTWKAIPHARSQDTGTIHRSYRRIRRLRPLGRCGLRRANPVCANTAQFSACVVLRFGTW